MSRKPRPPRPHPPRSATGTPPAAAQPAPEPAAAARPAARRWVWAALLGGLALLAGVLAMVARPGGANPPPAAPVAAAPPAGFVANAQCLGCHAAQATLWQGSHHAQAMGPATVQALQARFDGREFRHQGVTSRFLMKDGRPVVRTDGPDGRLADFDVAFTFGVAPLQQLLIAQPGGRLQPLQIAWDSPRERWFHLLPHEKTPPGDVLHWTGRYQTANTMCIGCHTTGFEKRYDAAADRFDSRWAEPNVSCQACHGPGSRHLAWAAQRAGGAAPADAPGEHLGLPVRLKGATGPQQVEACANCHSRRSELTAAWPVGRPRLDHQLPALLTESLYHADGQQLDEVFVDGSYRQSRMYQRGVGCSSCHDAHSGRLRASGNAVCTACHAPAAAAATGNFAGAAGAYDTPAHHFHAAGSAGAQCVACHMPAKTYMQIQARPDHSLRVPRPDLSVKIGTPNACTGCHADRPAQWAADQVRRWYGPDSASRHRQAPHFGEVLAAARAGRPGAAEGLARLAVDPERPPIVRATALAALRHDAGTGMAERLRATRDGDAEVRAAAADSFDAAPTAQRVYALGPLLADPVRAVRIAAARGLSAVPAAQIEPSIRPAFDAALAEYIAAQNVALDMPGARLNLAVVYGNTGQPAEAERQYRAALAIDPDFTPARANLARLLSGAGRADDAERVLAEGLKRQPGIGELQYALGLLIAEHPQRLPEAAAALQRAAGLLPGQARVHYNLGLALQQLGRRPAAEQALLKARQLDEADPAPAQALAIFHAQANQWPQAVQWARVALQLAPGDARMQQLVARLGPRPGP